MEVTLNQLSKLPIKRLKALLKNLEKDKSGQPGLVEKIQIIKAIIEDRKRNGLVVHPDFIKNGTNYVRMSKAKPINVMVNEMK